MKKIEVKSDSVETKWEAVVEAVEEEYESDRTAADYADAEPIDEENYQDPRLVK